MNLKAGFLSVILIFLTSILIINNSCNKNKNLPELTTYTITTVNESNAICGGNITSDGGKKITSRGVCWSTNEHPTIADNKTNDGKGTGSFTSTITGFSTNTRYYVRAFATNKNGTSYGSEVTFFKNTISDLPIITTYAAISVTQATATSGGNITYDGGSEITARGVCWDTTQSPVTSSSHTTDGTGKGIFISNIAGLISTKTYYVRAYATNSTGTVYGNQISFTASNTAVSTNAVFNITQTTADCGGNVISDGGSAIFSRGICWSTSQNPVATGSHTTDGSGTGNFISNMTGLLPSTTYYVRAYVNNSFGTTYGNEVSFSTQAAFLTTTLVSNITQTTAVSGGNITSDGGSAVTDRGVCWSTLLNPVNTDSHTSDGTGTGIFSSNLTNLTENTIYYIRAYMINSSGVSYGNQLSFTTPSVQYLPTVITTSVNSFTQTSAISGGNITSDGGASITDRGVCWNINPAPLVSDNHTSDGTGSGIFSSNVTGLAENTTYYLRAYATNIIGTAYGDELSFILTCGMYTITDADGNSYNTKEIGTQCWMRENLKTSKYSDGTSLPNIFDNTEWNNLLTGAYCDYDNLTSNAADYGHLYNWYAFNDSRNICPSGWHVPSETDWTTLIDLLGGSTVAGGKLKEAGITHWQNPNAGATNSSGFTGLPGGQRTDTGYFGFIRTYGLWWSEEVSTTNAWYRSIYYNNAQSYRISLGKNYGFSIRCIKN